MRSPAEALNDSASQPDCWVTVGYVLRAHGVDGRLRIRLVETLELAEGESPHWLTKPMQIRLVSRQGRAQIFKLRQCRLIHQAALIACEGIADREAAQVWAGAQWQVQKSCLPAPDLGEAYAYELQDAHVYDSDGQHLGQIRSLWDNHGQILLALFTSDGQERLLPLVDETFVHFDRDAHRLTVRLPVGIWDDDGA